MNTLPNLIIVGAGRAGTTHVQRLLSSHPKIWMNSVWPRACAELARRNPHSTSSEIHFFSTELYDHGLNFYKRFFDGVYYEKDEETLNRGNLWAADQIIDTFKYIGEKSPSYLSWRPEGKETPIDRIKKDLGEDVKIIFCVREPAQRAHSQWAHLQDFSYGPAWQMYENIDFEDAIKPHEAYKWLRGLPHDNLLLDESDYGAKYKELTDKINPENIHVVVNEEMKLFPIRENERIFDWLGLEVPKYRRSAQLGGRNDNKLDGLINFSNYSQYGCLSDGQREKLKKYFAKSKEQFYNLLGREIKLWEI